MKTTLLSMMLVAGLALMGCDGKAMVKLKTGIGSTDPDGNGPGNVPPPSNIPPDVNPASCTQGYSYVGFGGTELVVGRSDEDEGFDRDRVKPLDALRGEYARVLGTTPDTINTVSNTFGTTPPRWYMEPQASAVSLFSSFRIAFAGCVPLTDTTDFDATPTAAGLITQCQTWSNKFWSRNATQDELDSCADTVLNHTSDESNTRLKWAYGCATVLSSAGFLAY
jgi:hypothetical protein